MCYPVPCRVCGKTTWAGCGEHIADVRAQVPPEQWCAGHGPAAPAPAPAFPGGPAAPFAPYPASKSTPWLSYAALAVALVALVAAIAAYVSSPPPAASGIGGALDSFSAQQTNDAKKKLCDGAGLARVVVQFNTNMTNPVPGDPVGDLAVGSNARLALSQSAQYLHALLAKEPATPTNLATAVNSYADILDELAMGYLSGKTAEEQNPLRDDLKSAIDDIDDLCPQ